jgi:hypothetical protein
MLTRNGHVLRNQQITVENGRITRIAPGQDKPAIDLGGLTVMPGWIDMHVHPTWFFNKDNRLELDGPGAKSTPQQAALPCGGESVRHSGGWLHDCAERRGGVGRRGDFMSWGPRDAVLYASIQRSSANGWAAQARSLSSAR